LSFEYAVLTANLGIKSATISFPFYFPSILAWRASDKIMVPNIARVGIFWNPAVAIQAQVINTIKEVAQPRGIVVHPLGVQMPGDIERAFQAMDSTPIDGLITLVESFTLQQRSVIAKLAIERKLPTVFEVRNYVDAGGLLSYGVQYEHHYARAASYVAKILRGSKPADLPIELPTRFDFVINMRTAAAIGREIPNSLSVQATEIIE
jgi:ABC-type uncharacterized transport system substrate-binding protein